MKEGDFSTELIAIEEGTADVIKGGETVATLRPGDLIGEMGLLSREPRNARRHRHLLDAGNPPDPLGGAADVL